jgi:DNA-binding transcriptional regulator YhcF (GntR family)
MNLQNQICKTFCDGFHVREVPKGYAITSPFTWLDDEPLVFYANKKDNQIRFEDSGASLMYLEDIAGDLTSEARMETIRDLASQHGVNYNDDAITFSSQWFDQENAGKGVINFLSFMNRLQDLQFLSREKAENLFREDLIEAINGHFKAGYNVSERHEISPNGAGYISDVFVSSVNGNSAAVYAATAEVKVLEALLAAELVRREGLSHITPFLVFEDFIGSSVSQKNRKRSMNNEVLKLADWSGGKDEIIGKIEATLKEAA